MKCSNQETNINKDLLIKKQKEEIEKLQLEVNAMRIRLSGMTLKKENLNIETQSSGSKHQNFFWNTKEFMNRATG